MSQKLINKPLDSILLEWYGPHVGRNYFSTVTPQLIVSLFGTGEIVIETTTVFTIRGTNNSNAIGSVPVRGGKLFASRDPGDWSILATIDSSTSTPAPQIVTLTPTTTHQALRARVTGTGTGSVTIVSDWS